ncbi:MBL fold metallo-hydrolase [Tistlia consotensis]|uniref:MBL fold metallo-hydrolase n=1 Tax=Tistlia consotensis TaxID=1321365 RepID=UPI000A168A8B|nr:MBL fold metallo-hydrolase [Tistlia consotensis]
MTFWGVRGSIACPGPDYSRYGGNTSCLEVRCGGQLLIFDAGTGLRPLGQRLVNDCGPEGLDFDIFLTHTHIDHIAGVPFFAPLFDKRNRIRFHAGHLEGGVDLHHVLCKFMSAPLFPVPPAIFAADCSFLDFECGETLTPRPGVTLKTAALNHPNGACGYRIEYGGRSICYLTDTEHVEGERDSRILRLAEGTDLIIYDSSYTDAEFPRYRGWGHSTWQEGVRLAEATGARLAIFHHDPSHDDAFMGQVAEQAEAARPGTVVAREGMTLSP